MQDITSKVSQEDMDNARMSRERSTNPPDFEPGMSDDDDLFDSLDDFGGGGSNMDDFGNNDSGFGASGGGFGAPGGGFGAPGGGFGVGGGFGQQQQQNNKAPEDKFFDVLKNFFVGFKDWAKNFIQTFKELDVRKRVNAGKYIFIIGLVCAAIGFICIFFTDKFGFQMLASSLFASAFGVVLFMFSYDKAKTLGVDLSNPEFQPQPQPENNDFGGGLSDEIDFSDEDDDISFDDDDFGEDDGDEINIDDLDDFVPVSDEPDTLSSPPVDSDTVLASVNIDHGMVTRQYLYETITQILPNCDTTYDKEIVYNDDSPEFNSWDAIIKQAADVFRGNQEDSPNLLELKDKLFYWQLTVSRVKWIKNVEQLVDELVNIVKYDDNGGCDDSVYGTGVYVGNKAIIKIYKGSTAMVSVKDAYRQCKDFVLDTGNKMPVVLGIDSEGKVVIKDLSKIFALCVAGMPRSGKTWLVQSMLTQMMSYMKPSELEFYIYDPKDKLSDFRAMTMPHIKDFRSRDEDIVAGLKYIVKVEAERRNNIIGGAGFVNIEDYKKANPMAVMPYLYVVIDEVITFATRMKDEKPDMYKEFQSYLKELVSRLPGMGIRLFMIPHVLKNDIIQKTTTDLIPCRISVKGTPDHIEAVTGAKPREFTNTLTHSGDMAVRLDGYTNFCHAAILTSTNEGNNHIFNFLTQFWLKIEPESIKGSVYERNLKQDGNIEELKRLGSTLSNEDVDDLLSGVHSKDTDKSKKAKKRTAPVVKRDMSSVSDRNLGESSSAGAMDDDSLDDLLSGLDDDDW